MPITSLADGTAIAIISPYSAFAGPYAVNTALLPFLTIAAGSSTNPYAAAPNYGASSPLNAQSVNAMTFGVDAIMLDFI